MFWFFVKLNFCVNQTLVIKTALSLNQTLIQSGVVFSGVFLNLSLYNKYSYNYIKIKPPPIIPLTK